jgi:hypothetical protein
MHICVFYKYETCKLLLYNEDLKCSLYLRAVIYPVYPDSILNKKIDNYLK